MNRKEIALKGGVIGVISQVINLVMKFVVRSFVIRCLGRDILGLDGVIVEAINMLSLAEMGITSAMLFHLYAPLIKGDNDRVNQLMATYRNMYRYIAVVIAALGVILSFALPIIIHDINIPWDKIYVAFFLQLSCSVSSYLLAYYRILLNADQKKHICILIDLLANIIGSSLKILAVIAFENYSLYISAMIVQTVISNVIVYRYAKKNYTFLLSNVKVKRSDTKLILKDTKDIFGNKIASFVYSSTDNVIISSILGTGIVGVLTNYKYMTVALKGLMSSALSIMQPLIGNYLNSDMPLEASYKTLKRYTFVRFFLGAMVIVPYIAISDTFVLIWTGNVEYLMPRIITYFLAADFYIGCIYGALGEYVMGLGMFKSGKNVNILAAVINLVFSLIGVMVCGCEGVLAATVFSQFVLWIGEAYIVFIKYYKSRDYLKKYIILESKHLLCIVVCILLVSIILRRVKLHTEIIRLLLASCFSVIIVIAVVFVVYKESDELMYLKQSVFSLLHKVRKEG